MIAVTVTAYRSKHNWIMVDITFDATAPAVIIVGEFGMKVQTDAFFRTHQAKEAREIVRLLKADGRFKVTGSCTPPKVAAPKASTFDASAWVL